jgi:hypothetical protein
MRLKRAMTIAILAFLLNAASLYNAALAVWSLVLLVFSIFLLYFRDGARFSKDRKFFGFIQLFMLIGIAFLSTVMSIVGFYQLWFMINLHISPYLPLAIGLAVIGTVIYYYLLIKLIQEAYGVFKLKGAGHEEIEETVEDPVKKQPAAQSDKEIKQGRSSKIKARYIILIAFFSVIVNFLSVYNYYLGICSIFVLLIISISAFIVTLVNRANKADPRRRNFAAHNLSQYGTLKPTQVMNKIAVIFGLAVVYFGSIAFTVLQVNEREQLDHFLSAHVQFHHVHMIAGILSVIGYVLFVLSLILVTVYCIRMIRSEQMFVGKAS